MGVGPYPYSIQEQIKVGIIHRTEQMPFVKCFLLVAVKVNLIKDVSSFERCIEKE